MHFDARHIDDNSVIEGDICIVGAGATGLSMALKLINTPYKVILLEGGGFEYDDRVQELYNGKITGHPYYPNKASRLHYFGGSTMHFGGISSTFNDIDFEKRDWVANSGWPISLKDISPYYTNAGENLDLIDPTDWDTSSWLKRNEEFVALPLDDKAIWSKMWQFSPPTRFGTKYKNTIVNAKNILLYTYANVTNITANEGVNNIENVTVKNYAGKQHTVKAKHFVLACCSIQNARILLSCSKQAPKGLGNDNDLVGRYFMEHIEINSGELWLNHANHLKFYEMVTGTKVRAELAISAEKQKELKVSNGSISLMPLEMSKKTIPSVKLWTQDDPRKSLDTFKKYSTLDKRNFVQRMFSKSIFQSYGLFTRMEQIPNPNSRVVLSDEKDELGMPRANLHWALLPEDKKSVYTINRLLGEQVGIAGIGRVKLSDWLADESVKELPEYTSGGWHHLGTTRMSDSPKTGVVDANCKVFGLSNLYITGASCYTTGGAVNPTLTAIALTLRLTDHLKQKIKGEDFT